MEMSTSSVVVTKSSPVVVVPWESELATPPATGDAIALSSFDKCMPPFPVMAVLAFERPIHNPVETIKASLSRALAHYHPIAGRLDSGGARISCTGDGVTFVGASASCTMDEAMPVLQEMDLTVRYPGLLCHDDDPLLLLQVTGFSCGGFAIGVTWNHVALDGVGMGQFLQAVGELARGVPAAPSVVPVRHWDHSLPDLPSYTVAENKSAIDYGAPMHLARLDVTVPSSLINRIKAAGEFGLGGEATAFEAVTAVLWRCRTRAVMSADDPDSPAPLTFFCNMRAHAGARAGYYGNCVGTQVVMATSGVVARSSVGDLVAMIRRAKEKASDLLLGADRAVVTAASDEGKAPPLWYETFAVTSWRNLGMDAADFGGGAAARVMWHAERTMVPGCVVCPPPRGEGRNDDGVDVSALCVKPEHAGGFLVELASMAASASASV